jgi:hypothetical protein
MKINERKVLESIDYIRYRDIIYNLFKEGKSTGPIQSEELLHYSELNIHRMNRVEKTVQLSETLKDILNGFTSPQIWLVISEGWCGDSAQIVPVFHLIEKQFPHINLKLLFRDENLDLMDQFLTNGSRSIPKLLILDASNFELLAQWGPQPKEALELINGMKASKAEKLEIKEKLHLWYAKNKGIAIQAELAELLKNIKAGSI